MVGVAHRDKTATVGLHGNSYEVDTALVGRKVELVFDPFDLTRIEARWHGRSMGPAVPHRIGRHVHHKARPDDTTPPPAAPQPSSRSTSTWTTSRTRAAPRP